MTTAELARIAATVIPPVATTGWRLTVLDLVGPSRTTEYAVVPVIAGRIDGKPVYRGSQRDCHRFLAILEGRDPAPRRTLVIPPVELLAGQDGPARGFTEPQDPASPITEAATPREPAENGARIAGSAASDHAVSPLAPAAPLPPGRRRTSPRAAALRADGDFAGSVPDRTPAEMPSAPRADSGSGLGPPSPVLATTARASHGIDRDQESRPGNQLDLALPSG